jgi:hypothetical protein
MSNNRICGAILAAAVASGTCGAAVAAETTDHVTVQRADELSVGRSTFATTFVSVDHPRGALEGSLNLTVGRDGTILGYYRAAGSANLLDVTGGVDGRNVYIDIPGFSHITGQVGSGGIVGYTYFAGEMQRFTAKPEAGQI